MELKDDELAGVSGGASTKVTLVCTLTNGRVTREKVDKDRASTLIEGYGNVGVQCHTEN